jgi:peptide/nickel transport system substrate-binding protein
LAQKAGGILKMYHFDSPPSMSIHEEVMISTAVPMMGVFNNLVLYDQHVPQNSFGSIVPDLAESWAWSEDGQALTFKLRDGVKWHDGKPFTARDVRCTWEMLLGRGQPEGLGIGVGSRRSLHDRNRCRHGRHILRLGQVEARRGAGERIR